MTTTGRIIGWGTALPDGDPLQRRPRGPPRHHRRVDHRAHRHPERRTGGHHRGPRRRGRSGRHRARRRRPVHHRPAHPVHDQPRPLAARLGLDRAGAARARLRGVRPQRGLLRLRLRTGRRQRLHRHGVEAGPAHRRRDPRPHDRPRRPQHRDPVRQRRRARWSSTPSPTANRPSCSAGTSAPTAASSTSCTPRSAATCRWTAERSSDGPFG